MNDEKQLERLLMGGRIGRREFIERMAALGAVAAIPGALGRAQAATPKRGGRLRVGSSGASTTQSLAPSQGECCTEYTGLLHVSARNKLVVVDPDMNLVPELAESWEASPDATVWAFKIKQGIEFHNGKTMDLDDIIYSIEIHRKEGSSSPAHNLMKPIVDIKKDGKDTLMFTLDAGNADFPAYLADEHIDITIADDTEWKYGTGPFSIESFDPGVRFFGKRNPNYFKEGLPYFDEVEIIAIADANAKINALKTDRVDIIDHPDLKVLDLLAREPNLKVIKLEGLRHFTSPMSCKTPPFDNNDVRLAIKYAVDREALLEKLLRGYGRVGNDHPIARANKYYAAELEQRVYDPDKAKFHLKKGGLEGHKFQLHASEGAFTEAVDMAVLMQQSAAKAGIEIEIIREPADGYWSDIWMQKPWCFSYWSGRPTEDWMFSQAYAADSNWNESYWQNERFNRILKAARAELDEAKRREMYVEMQQICRDDSGNIVPLFQDQIMAASKRVMYSEPLVTQRLWDGNKAAERWWFA